MARRIRAEVKHKMVRTVFTCLMPHPQQALNSSYTSPPAKKQLDAADLLTMMYFMSRNKLSAVIPTKTICVRVLPKKHLKDGGILGQD